MQLSKKDFNHMTYNMKFFNFTPQQVSSERQHLVQSLIKNALNVAIKKIATPATEHLLAEKQEALVQKFLASCDKKLKILNKLDSQSFNVPTHVLQIQDFDLEHKSSKADEHNKALKLETLKFRYLENMAMLAALNAEKEKYASINEIIQEEERMHKKVYEACASFEFNKVNNLACKAILFEKQL